MGTWSNSQHGALPLAPLLYPVRRMQTLQDNREILKNVLNAIQAARTSFPMVLANTNRPLQPRPQPQNPVPIPARFNAAFSAIDALEEIISRSLTQEAFLAAQKLPPAPAVRKRKYIDSSSFVSHKV
ncbi:hypothetical protein FRC19_002378 [Serendipita sp. 401]|nr:hypothetical protein FRC19_002378 [Serendipita sp. 401]